MPIFSDISSSPAPRVRNAGLFDDDKNVPAHSHPEAEIIFTIQGQCTIEADSKRLDGTVGSLFIIPPGLRHNQLNHTITQTLYCEFHTTDEKYISAPRVLTVGRDYWLERWLNDIVQLSSMFNSVLADGLLTSIQLRIQQLENDLHHNNRLPLPVFRASQYIQFHYTEPVTLESIAANSGLSVSYLKVLFKRHFHCSPIQYLQQLRMQRAEMLLESPYLLVEEICHKCGYDDPSYFCRIFRKKHGLSPLAYRNRTHSP